MRTRSTAVSPFLPHAPLCGGGVLVLAALLSAGAVRGQQGCEVGAPLTLDDTVALLKDKTSDARIQQNVRACGVTFVADDAAVRQLTAAGASGPLVRLLAPPLNAQPGDSWTPLTDRRAMLRIPPAGA